MRLEYTPEFGEEVRRFSLRYRCPDCVYFLREEVACAHEWPMEDHLARHDPERPAAEVVFCKEFELR